MYAISSRCRCVATTAVRTGYGYENVVSLGSSAPSGVRECAHAVATRQSSRSTRIAAPFHVQRDSSTSRSDEWRRLDAMDLVIALRLTAERLDGGSTYQWGHLGMCNCGHLVE